MDVLVLLAALPAIAFGVFGRFYWAAKMGATHDTWYHFEVARRIRESRSLPERIDQFIVGGPYDYPPLLHLILAVLPEDVAFEYKWTFSPVVDVLHMGFVGAVTYWVTGSPTAAVAAVGIYATVPITVMEFSHLTPRVVGSFLLSVVVVIVFYALTAGSTWYLAIATVVGGILLLTHRMSSQTLAFMFLFFTAWHLQPWYLAVVAGSVVLATLLSAGHYATVLRGHVSIINFWRRQYNEGRSPDSFREEYMTSPTDDSEGDGRSSALRSIVERVKRFRSIPFVADSGWSFLLAGLLVAGWAGLLSPVGVPEIELSPFESHLATWALFIVVFAIMTQYLPKFKLVGEGYKYFMWGGFPTAVSLAVLLMAADGLLFSLGYVVATGGMVAYTYLRMRGRGAESNRRNVQSGGVLEFIDDAEGRNVMCLPTDMSFPIIHSTDKNVLFYQNPKREAEVFFPVPLEPLSEIADRFDIDLVLVDERRLDLEALDVSSFDELYESNGYKVLRVGRGAVTR